MAKVIKYRFKHSEGVDDIIEKTSPYTTENEEIAKREAYNSEYTIEDDGKPEQDTASSDDVLNALLGVTV